MNVSIDASFKSLNKHHEELCGDKVEILKTENANIMILADGMGSGVKANILATLTSKILGTMFLNGAGIDECVETIASTLPVCKEREIAYSTFSILQINKNGEAYLVEFDNPMCVFIREGRLQKMPYTERTIAGKQIREYHFRVQLNDCFIIMSDGVIHAGVGQFLNFGWTWESMAEYALKETKITLSASRLASILIKACDDLYDKVPGDDTTIAVARIINVKTVNLYTGPPADMTSDNQLIHEFMEGDAIKIICGGTSANIASRILDKPIKTSLEYVDATLPPIAYIEGIDLVTEGVLTLTRTLSLLKQYIKGNIDYNFFDELDKENGGSKVAKIIIESCTVFNLFVGKAMNEAHQNTDLPFDLSIRMNLVEQIKEAALTMGKEVHVKYY
ncbi:MAG: protein serine/threonine phosphatase [Anaerocolumna sp.]|nr:protein serine/threonine phosphatase [Anaerocolumna sp.]